MPPVIDKKRCKRCGQCAEACQCDVFFGSKKDEIPNVAEPVFDVISKDIEEPHIAEDVQKSPMEKHGGQKGEVLLEPCKACRDFWIGIS